MASNHCSPSSSSQSRTVGSQSTSAVRMTCGNSSHSLLVYGQMDRYGRPLCMFKWNDISIKGLNMLFTPHFHGLVMYCLLVGFQLCTGVDRLSFSCVGILVHDGNDWSFLCGDDSTCCYNRDLIDSVVINALYVNWKQLMPSSSLINFRAGLRTNAIWEY